MLKPGCGLVAAVLLAVASCGEDRTYEYVQKTQCDHWMQEAMQEYYLWGDSIVDLEWNDYFNTPETFFSKLTAMAPVSDTWSWCSIDTLSDDAHERGYFNHNDSYGIDFTIMTDPTGGTSRQYARVMTVYPHSPAERCGLIRGDFIGYVDGVKFTSGTASNLVSGKARTLVVSKLGVDETAEAFYWTSTDTVVMAASEYVEDVPFPVIANFDTSSGRLAYLMCNRLTEGPEERASASTAYADSLMSIMQYLSDVDPDILVLDLRLCNYGRLSMVHRLASTIAGSAASGRLFAQTRHRSDQTDQDENLYFDSSLNQLAISHLVVITSSYTCGAGEWLIRGLRSALGDSFVTTVGTTTGGQIVTTGDVPSDYYVTLHPATAYVANGNGDYGYASGIAPDIEIDEAEYADLYPYGSSPEILLATVLHLYE